MDFKLDQYDAAVHAIYDAALKPSRWPQVVEQLVVLFEARCGLLFTWEHRPPQGGFFFTHRVPPIVMEHWMQRHMPEDPFAAAAARAGLVDEGFAFNGADLVPDEQLFETRFYKDWWQPLGVGQLCCGIIFDATDANKLPTCLSLLRAAGAPRYEPAHADLMRRLTAHVSRSLGVMFHLRDAQWQLALGRAALDRLRSGVLLLDAEGRVLFRNCAAATLLERGDTLLLQDQRLRVHPRLAPLGAGLHQAVAGALRKPDHSSMPAHFSEILLLPGCEGEPQCVLHVAPLSAGHGLGPEQARAIAFVYDLQSATAVPPELLCKLFELTPAEAQAALQVLQGGSVDQMAQRLAVSANTFKSQLGAAYLKTGTHRQADLLKLLLALASR